MSDKQDLNKELEQWQRRLQKRREQKAKLGISADPSIDLEIEDIESRISDLQAKLMPKQESTASGKPITEPSEGGSLPAIQVTEPDPELARWRAKPRIFLCHASEDKPRVTELYQKLKKAGYHPWLDKYDLLPGQDWRREIRKVLTNPYNLVLICMSQSSITKRGVVQQEIKWTLDIMDQMPEDTIYLVPVRLEDCQAPDRLGHLHWVNLFEPDGFDNLKRAIDFELSQR